MTGAEGELRTGFVALIGWTNVGKSTLLNLLLRTKVAAVADVAQTTRHRISGILSVAGRGQLILVDTPGFHRPRHKMNRTMVEVARQSMRDVDLILLLLDAERGIGPGDREIAERLHATGVAGLGVLNKIDRVRPKSRLLPMLAATRQELGLDTTVPISARTGDGCEELLEEVWKRVPLGAPLYPEETLTDQPARLLAAEWIREKLLRATREELPHATAVFVERWKERDDGLTEIDATVLVERESQKRIVIGRGGEVLKQIGSSSRHELEELLGCKVFLRLWVKVREHWRDNESVLHDLGL